MPRNKVLEKAKVNVSASRSAVDLSQERAQTALAGEIQCVYAQPFVKGSRGTINRECFTRMADVVSPAFHRITEHYDFFMVPLHAIWRPWENYKLNMNDMQDSLTVPWDSASGSPDLTLPAFVPRLNFYGLVEMLGYSNPATNVEQTTRLANDVLRFCDEMRYGEYAASIAADPQGTNSRMMNFFVAAAYQKCYFEHYRNTAYESNNPYAYNFDWLITAGTNQQLRPDASTPANLKHTQCAQWLFTRRRVNYRNDYFHNLYPSLNYVLFNPNGSDFKVPSSVGGAFTGSGAGARSLVANPSYYNGVPYVAMVTTTGAVNTSFTPQTIRAAFALDKLMRAAAYAPKHVREQYKAQFGVDGKPYDEDMRSQRLGSFQSDVAFQEVTNMAQSSSANLGDLGAKGVGASNKDKGISFYCEHDCIIIGLRYFMPRARYDASGIHPWNTKIVREDFYQKAFENLGLRPFYYYNIDDSVNASSNRVVGWTVPNFEYKIAPDLNFDCFKEGFYSYGVTSSQGSINQTKQLMTDQLKTFVPHTSEPLKALNSTNADYFKVAPEDLDNLFVQQIPAWHPRNVYQFFSDIRIKCAAVIPMSLHGQPGI